MDQAQRRRQHGLESDRADRGFRERQPLDLDVLRIVIGHDHVDEPCGDRVNQCPAIVLGAQRRR